MVTTHVSTSSEQEKLHCTTRAAESRMLVVPLIP